VDLSPDGQKVLFSESWERRSQRRPADGSGGFGRYELVVNFTLGQ
jgi:hypothetical protein